MCVCVCVIVLIILFAQLSIEGDLKNADSVKCAWSRQLSCAQSLESCDHDTRNCTFVSLKHNEVLILMI